MSNRDPFKAKGDPITANQPEELDCSLCGGDAEGNFHDAQGEVCDACEAIHGETDNTFGGLI